MTPFAYVLLAASASVHAAPKLPVEVAQVTIRQRIIVRVPAMAPQAAPLPMPRPSKWKEVKGPKCVAVNQLAGAAFTRADSVDLFLRGGRRVRAQLDNNCPALDYYSGFYLTPTRDGQVCGGRDTIRTRSGGQCDIERFRELVPQR